jgi:hypothetical protein
MNAAVKRSHWLALGAAGLGAMFLGARFTTATDDAHVEALPAKAAPPETAASVVPVAIRQDRSSAADPLALGGRARSIPRSDGDAFATVNWKPAPPPAPEPPASAPPAQRAPMAPPLPFAFVGMVENGLGRPTAFLSKGDDLLVVVEADVIDNRQYRVDTISASGLVLTYLPLGMKQTLKAGAKP